MPKEINIKSEILDEAMNEMQRLEYFDDALEGIAKMEKTSTIFKVMDVGSIIKFYSTLNHEEPNHYCTVILNHVMECLCLLCLDGVEDGEEMIQLVNQMMMFDQTKYNKKLKESAESGHEMSERVLAFTGFTVLAIKREVEKIIKTSRQDREE